MSRNYFYIVGGLKSVVHQCNSIAVVTEICSHFRTESELLTARDEQPTMPVSSACIKQLMPNLLL